jgi:hypothetical protein
VGDVLRGMESFTVPLKIRAPGFAGSSVSSAEDGLELRIE